MSLKVIKMCQYQLQKPMTLESLLLNVIIKTLCPRFVEKYRPGQPNWKYTVWKFQDFPPHRFYVKSIFVILKPQICHFDHLCSSGFWFLGNFWIYQAWNFFKNQNSKPPKLLKWQSLTFWNQPKLISRKISDTKIAKFPYFEISIVKIQIL